MEQFWKGLELIKLPLMLRGSWKKIDGVAFVAYGVLTSELLIVIKNGFIHSLVSF